MTTTEPSADRLFADRRPKDLKRAARRGFFGRCPRCGMGKMFSRFLKIGDFCPFCHAALSQCEAANGADSVGIGILWFSSYSLSPDWVDMGIWSIITLGLSMTTLRLIKGAIIGLRWSRHAEGFR
jgi:uncharacterized protein (DUF983 family)